jgi:hypothetical protein
VKHRTFYTPIIDAYDGWINRMVNGQRSAYYLNFMFGQLPSSSRGQKDIMRNEVERVYATLVTREVRRPRSICSQPCMPRFFGCPDYPVVKRDKKVRRLVVANEGAHFNGILVLSDFGRGLLDPEKDLPHAPYVLHGGPLERIHVTPIEHGSMASYTFKSIRKITDQEDVLILPRTLSEMPDRA